MKIFRILFTLCIIAVVAVALIQIAVKNLVSPRLGEEILSLLAENGMESISFEDLEIDLLGSRAVLTNFSARFGDHNSQSTNRTPRASSGSVEFVGTFTAPRTEIEFTLGDAVSSALGSPVVTRGTVSFTNPELISDGAWKIRTVADSAAVEFHGRLAADTVTGNNPDSLSHFLQEEQSFIVRLGNVSVSTAGSSLLPTFLESLEARTIPVSSLEIALLTSTLLPNLPVTRNFVDRVTRNPVFIEPRKFSRAADLVLELLGIGTDEPMKSDGTIRAVTRGEELVISGTIVNKIGTIDVSGAGKLNSQDVAGSQVDTMTIEITELAQDISDLIQNQSLTFTLNAPVALRNLIQGDYRF